MKLLRITSQDNQGVIKSFLNQDLKLEPFSQVALGQLSAHVLTEQFIVTQANNKFTFKTTGTGALREVYLTLGTYDNKNFQVLLDDLNKKVNEAIGILGTDGAKITITSGSNIGRQAQIHKGKDGKIYINFKQGPSIAHFNDIVDNIYKTSLTITGTTENSYTIKSTAVAPDLTYAHSTYQTFPLGKGCAVHRIRIDTLTGDNTNNAGYTLSLTKKNPTSYFKGTSAPGLLIGDISYAIALPDPFAATGTYKYILNGVQTDTAIVPSATTGSDADTTSIEIVQGKIRLVVYQNDAGDTSNPHTRVLYEEPYDESDLYGVYSLHGIATRLSLRRIKFTSDPYLDTVYGEPDLTDLTGSRPGQQSTKASIHTINFNNELGQYLGFEKLSYTLTAKYASFRPESIFKGNIRNDAFLVEFQNLQLDSYDTFVQQRKNILALIPYDDENEQVSYDASNLNFLDLNNKEPINITSLNLRLLTGDYSTPDLFGLTSLVLYFKPKSE